MDGVGVEASEDGLRVEAIVVGSEVIQVNR